MNLKKLLNLNTYEWWRNHRRFITLGIFLALAAGYIRSPIARDFKVKDTCSRIYSDLITSEEAARSLNIPKEKVNPYTVRNYCDGFISQ